MARAVLYHERQGENWKPVGVFLATQKRLDYRVLPGSARREAWMRTIATESKPPFKDGIGLSLERGTWEDDWVPYALDSLSNGHDTWMTEVEPEPTSAQSSSLESTYAKYVLGSKTGTTRKDTVPVADEVPELSGYKKVTPA